MFFRRSHSRTCRNHHFTLIEMLVVSLIVAMVFLIVMPRVIRAPKRMAIEQMLTDLRQACLETSARARATGTELELRLETDGGYGGMFIVAAASDITLSQDWSPPMPTNQEEQLSAAVLATINRYPLPADIEWQGLQDYSEDNPCRFVFYPDGEATGPKLRFTFKGIDYELSVDSLTGKPIIMEFAK